MEYSMNLHLFDADGGGADGGTAGAAEMEGTQNVAMPEQIESGAEQPETLEQLNEALRPLYQMHGVREGDAVGLVGALMQANEAGQPPQITEQHIQQMEQMRYEMRERAANEQIAAWQAEEAQIREQYPEFTLMQEIHNPLFASLIASRNQATRLSLRAAYEACHVDKVRQMAAREAAKAAESNTLHNIRAGANRPREAGSGAEAAVAPSKIDITRLTRAERRELERRAERGEKITFQEGSRKL